MRELPILFSTPMIQAILDGRKTMTRRAIKDRDITNWFDIDVDGTAFAYIEQSTGDSYKPEDTCPYQPGDHLYVRETWRCVKYDNMDGDLNYGVEFKDGTRKYFKFDDNERYHQFGKFAFKEGWQPSIYLPKEAARMWLEVVSVKVERLQGITEEDAGKEGVKAYGPNNCSGTSARIAFAELWDSINAKRGYGWDSNPWVWVIEFKKVTPCN